MALMASESYVYLMKPGSLSLLTALSELVLGLCSELCSV
jgi:hypothetical protein